jgi:hypothetical protein
MYVFVFGTRNPTGSQYYNDTSNFMLYGGCKNWRGHSKSCSHNTIVFPGLVASAGPNCEISGGLSCDPLVDKTCEHGSLFADTFFEGNDCIVPGSTPYRLDAGGHCYATAANLSAAIFHMESNHLYTYNATFSARCGSVVADSLEAWQAAGQDPGTTVDEWPTPGRVLAMGKHRLGL